MLHPTRCILDSVPAITACVFDVVVRIPIYLQTSPVLDPGLANLVGNLGVVAVLVWYVIYDVRVRTPSMMATFAKEQEASRIAFHTEQTAIRAAFAIEQQALRTQYNQEIAEYRQMLRESLHSMRNAVHDVKETAQVVVTRQDIQRLEQNQRDNT